jgi:hypothetical protein
LPIDPESVKAITSAVPVMAARTSSIVPSYDQGATNDGATGAAALVLETRADVPIRSVAKI